MKYGFLLAFYSLWISLILVASCSRPTTETSSDGAAGDDIQGAIPFENLAPQFKETLGNSELDIENMDNLTITNPEMELVSMEWSEENPNYLEIVTLINMDVSENTINGVLGTIIPGGIAIPASIRYSMDFNFEINAWEISYDRKGGEWEPGDNLTAAAMKLMEIVGPVISNGNSNFDENIEAAFESSVSKIIAGLPNDALDFVAEMDSGTVPESAFITLLDKPKESLSFSGKLDSKQDALVYTVEVK